MCNTRTHCNIANTKSRQIVFDFELCHHSGCSEKIALFEGEEHFLNYQSANIMNEPQQLDCCVRIELYIRTVSFELYTRTLSFE